MFHADVACTRLCQTSLVKIYGPSYTSHTGRKSYARFLTGQTRTEREREREREIERERERERVRERKKERKRDKGERETETEERGREYQSL